MSVSSINLNSINLLTINFFLVIFVLFLIPLNGWAPSQSQIKYEKEKAEKEERIRQQRQAKFEADIRNCVKICGSRENCIIDSFTGFVQHLCDKAVVGYGDQKRVIVDYRKFYGDGFSNATKEANKHCSQFGKNAIFQNTTQTGAKDFQSTYSCE